MTSPETTSSTQRSSGRNLPVAIVVGVLLAALFVGSVLFGPAAFALVIAGLVSLASLESSRILRRHGWPVMPLVVWAGALGIVLGAYAEGPSGQAAGVLALFLGSVAWQIADSGRRQVMHAIAGTLAMGVWLGLGSYGVLLIRLESGGADAVFAVVGAAIIGDVAAYAVGYRFGRRPVAPTLSPNKTVEGLAGGVAVAGLAALVVVPLLGDLLNFWQAGIVGVVSALAGFFGDLMESMLKRDLGIKDFGALFPGHGGVLDRVDGILLALPVGYLAVSLLTG